MNRELPSVASIPPTGGEPSVVDPLSMDAPAAWFCLKTGPKKEGCAARHLSASPEVEVYSPRIRFRKSTARGRVWFNEALFPGYLFARFQLARNLRMVSACQGVSTVVSFAGKYPPIPERVIEDLRVTFGRGAEDALEICPRLQPGDRVSIEAGPFRGFHGVLSSLHNAKYRAAVLLEFLGDLVRAEVPLDCLAAEGLGKAAAIRSAIPECANAA